MRLNKDQRKLYADKILDFAHLLFGGLVVGQFLADKRFHIDFVIIGIFSVVFLYWLSYILTRSK